MKTLLAVTALLVLTACGSGGENVAHDPAGSPSETPMPTEIPAATGEVRTRNLATVMDTGPSDTDGPELCLGAVAESYPPACGGPPIAGWHWQDQEGMFNHEGDVRWGEFLVTGTFDGTTVTVTDAIAAALYDPAPTESPSYPAPATAYSEAELADIAETVGQLPGAQGAYTADGHALVDVTYDDGSLQAWADEEYGEDVVIVTSALVPAD